MHGSPQSPWSWIPRIVYKDALEYEFSQLGIPFEREMEFEVSCKETILKHKFYADFVVHDKIILEVKAVSEITNEFLAMGTNYLKVSSNKLALIVNFGESGLSYKRLVF